MIKNPSIQGYFKWLKQYGSVNQYQNPKYMNIDSFIKSHKHWIQYCEAIMDENGLIAEARPSHIYALFGNYYTKIKHEYLNQDDPIYDLPKLSHDYKKILIWYDRVVIGFIPSEKVIASMYKLYTENKISFEAIVSLTCSIDRIKNGDSEMM